MTAWTDFQAVPSAPQPAEKGRRKGDRQVLVRLPRKDPYLEVAVQRAYRVAGCCLCNRPIAKGDARLAMTLRLGTVRETRGEERDTERYYAHARCILDALGTAGVEALGWERCYDCGGPTESGSLACYTTSQFAFGQVCRDCSILPRWRPCESCGVFFPHWMVSYTREDIELCDWCAQRTGNETRNIVEKRKAEFETVRRELIAKGPYG